MAWTITPTIHRIETIKHQIYGDRLIIVKLACISDASGGTITMKATSRDKTDTYREIMDMIKGSWLYLIKTVPGTGGDVPTGVFDLDVEDDNNDHLLDTDANSNVANGFVKGNNTLNVFPPIMDEITVVIGTLGDTNTADIYLYFSK
jgi:hypothetical protein